MYRVIYIYIYILVMLLACGSCKESAVKMTGQSSVDSEDNVVTYDMSQGL